MVSTKNKKPDLRLPIGSRRLAAFVFHRMNLVATHRRRPQALQKSALN
jgi:hypothetical protein